MDVNRARMVGPSRDVRKGSVAGPLRVAEALTAGRKVQAELAGDSVEFPS